MSVAIVDLLAHGGRCLICGGPALWCMFLNMRDLHPEIDPTGRHIAVYYGVCRTCCPGIGPMDLPARDSEEVMAALRRLAPL